MGCHSFFPSVRTNISENSSLLLQEIIKETKKKKILFNASVKKRQISNTPGGEKRKHFDCFLFRSFETLKNNGRIFRNIGFKEKGKKEWQSNKYTLFGNVIIFSSLSLGCLPLLVTIVFYHFLLEEFGRMYSRAYMVNK